MKNKFIYNLILLINLMLIGNTLFSQNMYNVFDNTILEIKNGSRSEVYSKRVYFREKIEISNFVLEANNNPKKELINKKLSSLCNHYLNDEMKSLEIYNEFKKRLEVYNKVNSSRNNGYSRNACSLNMFQLKSVKSAPLSIIDKKLFLEVRFLFKRDNRGEYDSEMEIIHYYIADLRNGKVKRWENEISNKENIFIRKFCE